MPQVFHGSFNTIFRVAIVGAGLGAVLFVFVLWVLGGSPYVTGAENVVLQPVPFSHEHHVGRFAFDCRYCHASVEHSSFAGMPSTETCMNCHSQIWVGSEMLRPVRESYRTGQPLRWNRVHNLQDFVYFDHSIHVQKGVGCVTCHGRVDEMPLLRQVAPLTMSWCLQCHRQPERFLRPRDEVFSRTWEPKEDQLELGRRLVKEYQIRTPQELTSCSICHR